MKNEALVRKSILDKIQTVKPVLELEGEVASATGENIQEVKEVVWDLVNSGRILVTAGRKLYNPDQPGLPLMKIVDLY